MDSTFEVVVRAGDTLWTLCRKHLGSSRWWPQVAHMNRLENPNIIHPGQTLRFPKEIGR